MTITPNVILLLWAVGAVTMFSWLVIGLRSKRAEAGDLLKSEGAQDTNTVLWTLCGLCAALWPSMAVVFLVMWLKERE